jgi:tetratricopeptide (TPR) repeat protein
MAYCQSELYAEYMQRRFGTDSTARLLDAYRDGLTTSQAIERLFQVSVRDFEAGYVEYLGEVAASLRAGPIEPPMSPAQLERAVVADPMNPDLAARLAGEYIKQRSYPRARELALKALELKAHHALGSFMLARLHTLVGDSKAARDVLEPALDRNDPDPRVLELLATVVMQAKEYETARELYELGRRCFPNDSKWIAGVARVALITDNRQVLREALEQLSLIEADDASPRRKLARMAAEDGDWPRAELFAWQTIHANVADADAHSILADALAGQQKWAEAAEEYRVLLELRPAERSAWLRLARALQSMGDREGAIAAVQQLLEKEPENTDGRELLKALMR